MKEFDRECDGTLLFRGAEEGQAAPVNTILANIGPEGTDVSGINTSAPTQKEKKTETQPKTEVKEISTSTETKTVVEKEKKVETSDDDRIFASPLARSLAEDKGIDLRDVTGTGDNGRIIKRDIENYTQKAQPKVAASVVSSRETQTLPNSQMRKVIARRLSESKFTAPNYHLTVEVIMDNCIESRKQINDSNPDRSEERRVGKECLSP